MKGNHHVHIDTTGIDINIHVPDNEGYGHVL